MKVYFLNLNLQYNSSTVMDFLLLSPQIRLSFTLLVAYLPHFSLGSKITDSSAQLLLLALCSGITIIRALRTISSAGNSTQCWLERHVPYFCAVSPALSQFSFFFSFFYTIYLLSVWWQTCLPILLHIYLFILCWVITQWSPPSENTTKYHHYSVSIYIGVPPYWTSDLSSP